MEYVPSVDFKWLPSRKLAPGFYDDFGVRFVNNRWVNNGRFVNNKWMNAVPYSLTAGWVIQDGSEPTSPIHLKAIIFIEFTVSRDRRTYVYNSQELKKLWNNRSSLIILPVYYLKSFQQRFKKNDTTRVYYRTMYNFFSWNLNIHFTIKFLEEWDYFYAYILEIDFVLILIHL